MNVKGKFVESRIAINNETANWSSVFSKTTIQIKM